MTQKVLWCANSYACPNLMFKSALVIQMSFVRCFANWNKDFPIFFGFWNWGTLRCIQDISRNFKDSSSVFPKKIFSVSNSSQSDPPRGTRETVTVPPGNFHGSWHLDSPTCLVGAQYWPACQVTFSWDPKMGEFFDIFQLLPILHV